MKHSPPKIAKSVSIMLTIIFFFVLNIILIFGLVLAPWPQIVRLGLGIATAALNIIIAWGLGIINFGNSSGWLANYLAIIGSWSLAQSIWSSIRNVVGGGQNEDHSKNKNIPPLALHDEAGYGEPEKAKELIQAGSISPLSPSKSQQLRGSQAGAANPVHMTSPKNAKKPPSPIWIVPHNQNTHYLDRTDGSLTPASLLETFANGGGSWRVLWGLIGVGKTQLVLEYAYRYGQGDTTKKYHCVMWLDASKSAEDGFAELNTKLPKLPNLPPHSSSTPTMDHVKFFKEWIKYYETTSNTKWLLIVDKCSKEDFHKIRTQLPLSTRGHILFTIRKDPGAIDFPKHHIGGMSIPDGKKLLMHAANRTPAMNERGVEDEFENALVEDILGELGRNPLMLYNAGIYIGRRLTFQEFLRRYKKGSKEFLKEKQAGNYIGHDESVDTLITMWLIIFNEILASKTAAAQVLWLCSYLEYAPYPIPIPKDIVECKLRQEFALNFTPSVVDDALKILEMHALIKYIEPGKTFVLEKILRDIIYSGLDHKGEPVDKAIKVQRKQDAIWTINQAFPKRDSAERDECPLYLPHVSKCIEYILDKKDDQPIMPEDVELLLTIGQYLHDHPQHEDGKHLQAEKLFEKASEVCENLSTSAGPNLSTYYHSIAEFYHEHFLYRDYEQTKRAGHFYTKARDSFSASPTFNPAKAKILNDLGRLHHDMGQYEDAGNQFEEALNEHKKASPPHDPMQEVARLLNNVAALNNLALIHITQGEHKKAEGGFITAEKMLTDAKDILTKQPSTYSKKVYLEQYEEYKQKLCIHQAFLYSCWNDSSKLTESNSAFAEARRVLTQSIAKDKKTIEEAKQNSHHISDKLYLRLARRLNNLAQLRFFLSQKQNQQEQKEELQKIEGYLLQALSYYLEYHEQSGNVKVHPLLAIIWGNLKEIPRDPKNKTVYKEYEYIFGLASLNG